MAEVALKSVEDVKGSKKFVVRLFPIILVTLVLYAYVSIPIAPTVPAATTTTIVIDSTTSITSHPSFPGQTISVSPDEITGGVDAARRAVDNGDPSMCDEITLPGMQHVRDMCFYNIAFNERDSTICEYVNQGSLKSKCHEKITEKINSETRTRLLEETVRKT